MKKALKLFGIVLLIAVAITVTQYETFSLLVNGEWAFIVNVFENLSAWTSHLNTIVFWKYAIVALALLVVLIVAFIKLCKKIFRKKSKKTKKVLPSRLDKETQTVQSSKTNTNSSRKFTRI